MSMTKKHYTAIANAIANTRTHNKFSDGQISVGIGSDLIDETKMQLVNDTVDDTIDYLAAAMAEIMALDNPNFDRDRFMESTR